MTTKYHKRWLETWICDAIKDEPVVILTGARQVGKSTLLKNTLPDWKYLSLDDFDALEQAERDPMPLLIGQNIIIDEAQRAPKLIQAVKQSVDASKRKCRFILSGSANMLLMSKVTESLAGRAVICELGPLTWGEFKSEPIKNTLTKLFEGDLDVKCAGNSDELDEAISHGWMPIVMLERKDETAIRWMEGYVSSYLERDLRQLSQIDSLSDFHRLMVALSLRSGQILNQTEVGRDVSIPQATVNRYINLLEASLLLGRLPAYAVNRTKRLIKSPKPYFVDSGLAAFLSGTKNKKSDEKFWGALFETAVFHHLRSWCQLQIPKANLYYWRTVSNVEVDFVIERGRDLVAMEVKSTSAPKYSHAESIKVFMEEYPETKAGVVVHMGDEFKQLDEKIVAIPFWALV